MSIATTGIVLRHTSILLSPHPTSFIYQLSLSQHYQNFVYAWSKFNGALLLSDVTLIHEPKTSAIVTPGLFIGRKESKYLERNRALNFSV